MLKVAISLALIIILAGCILPRGEAPLVTTSKDYILKEGQIERFRIQQGTTTPEYSLTVRYVRNVSALFILNPGSTPVALTKGQSKPEDLDGDGDYDVTLLLSNIEAGDAYLTLTVTGGAVQSATPTPTPVPTCATTCATGQSQRPYPDCSCFTPTQFCTDNTAYSTCSTTKPKYCDAGQLVDRCGTCGCATGLSCSGNSCVTPASPTPTPSATVQASVAPSNTAITTANATIEGQIMRRLETQYAKSQQCTQSEFESSFQTRRSRAPTQTEIGGYRATKNALPQGVVVTTTAATGATEVWYKRSDNNQPLLKVVVSGSAAVGQTWQGELNVNCGGGRTPTQCNTDTVTLAEGMTGNCGFILVLNGWN